MVDKKATDVEPLKMSTRAVAGSIVFTPDQSTRALRAMADQYGDQLWGKYGFTDAFNIDQEWFGPDVIGIDLGISLLMIENHRSGLLWQLFMSHPAIQDALDQAGFESYDAPPPGLTWEPGQE